MIHQIPTREDNYIYIVRDEPSGTTIVIDPTEHDPVLALCEQKKWQIDAILITHHHPDHIYGIPRLKKVFSPTVWGFKGDRHRLPPLDRELEGNEAFTIKGVDVLTRHTPGHTLGHLSYYIEQEKALFSGDTLFSMGCGRLFEGTPEMMLKSLSWIRQLPEETNVYCSHEYTQTNTEFALSIDPHNKELRAFYNNVEKLRRSNSPTVPMRLETEKQLNPFLRWDDQSLKNSLGLSDASADVEVFSHVRRLRDKW